MTFDVAEDLSDRVEGFIMIEIDFGGSLPGKWAVEGTRIRVRGGGGGGGGGVARRGRRDDIASETGVEVPVGDGG